VVCIAKRIGDTGEPCGTPASTEWLCRTSPSITISTVLSGSKLSVHRIWSPSIRFAFIAWISPPLAMLGNAALISIRRTPVMISSFHAECALSTMMAAASMAELFFLLPYWPSLDSALLSASLDSSLATTFWLTFPMQLNKEIVRYDLRFV